MTLQTISTIEIFPDERLTLELPGSLKSSQELANLNNISLCLTVGPCDSAKFKT